MRDRLIWRGWDRVLIEKRNISNGIAAVDLFSGCGGMSLGFERAGFDIRAAFDKWGPAIDVYRKNFEHPIFEQDLSDVDVSAKEVLNFKPALIFGGPPCQDFSTAGFQDESRGRAALSVSFAEIVARVKPRWFVMENVATIKNTNAFKTVCSLYRDAGYGLTCKVLDAAYCGVPQTRKRMFIVGGYDEPENFLEDILTSGLSDTPMSIRDYLGDSLGIDHYFRVPTNYSRRGIFSIDEPSMTIRAVDRPIPPGYKGNPNDSAPISEARALTPKERSYIQTFPKEFEFFGGKSDINTMVGNAVPVNLAKYVASALAKYIKRNSGERQ
nr:DNA cytosine methyltransferase [uncultured Adlercreutzia sp.]